MTLPARMKFGIFMAPFHHPGDNPTLAIGRDLELIQWLDHLGYDEAWIGEHHSAGWENTWTQKNSAMLFQGLTSAIERAHESCDRRPGAKS